MRAAWAGAVMLVAVAARADELPVSLQAQLLQKAATYITSLAPGDSGAVKVLVLHPGASPTRWSEGLAGALNQLGQLGKFKGEAKVVPVSGLKSALAAEKPQVIWVPPELDEKGVSAVLEAVGTSNIVTVSVVSAHVKQGVILGFDLLEAKPRILVHLKQARAQSVVFLSGLLTHSVIVER